jgi:CSLREA domain-containing protein
MYHQINPTEMFRERELALRKEAMNRSPLPGRRLRTGHTPKARSTIVAAVVGILGALVFASLMLAASSSPTHAQTTFLVTSIADQPDANTTDGKCFALNASCTLRAAIVQANATPEADVIDFSISGGEVQTIMPSSALPPITDQVTIDGYSQPGASPNTLAKGTNAVLKIELDGANAGNGAPGLDIQASNTVVKGLVINRFHDVGVEVKRDVADVSIEGNFIGTDSSGTIDRGNLFEGVRLAGTSATVGGASPDKRNLISGNDNHGVGMSALGLGNEVSGNLIGTKKDGLNPLGNADDGVFISQSSNNLVGGPSAAAANTIAFNGADGVKVAGNTTFPANGNRILRNSISLLISAEASKL